MTQQIPLYNRAGRSLFTLVNDDDFEWASDYRWRLSNQGYAIRTLIVDGKQIVLSLHREIMQPPPGYVVDHIDFDRLRNTKDNLRILTVQENLMHRSLFRNTSTGYRGVTYKQGKWHARIQKDGRDIHLGDHEDLRTAALVYDACAVKFYGSEIPYRNLPDQPIPPEIEALVHSYLSRVGETPLS
jgi:hypothetical protein